MEAPVTALEPAGDVVVDLDTILTPHDRKVLRRAGVDPMAVAEALVGNDLSPEAVANLVRSRAEANDPSKPIRVERLKSGVVVEHYRAQKGAPHGKITMIRRHPDGRTEEFHPTKGWRKKRKG